MRISHDTIKMSLYYSYIGCCHVTSGIIDIADPYINPITIAAEHIPVLNEKTVYIKNALPGIYDAYHLIDGRYDDPITLGIIIVHKAYNLEEINLSERYVYQGCVSAGLSGAIALIDNVSRFKTNTCYNLIEPDAYYDADKLLDCLEQMPYTDEQKKQLKELCDHYNRASAGDSPKGKEIIDIIGTSNVWQGFRSFDLNSSQWSIDAINRLENCNYNSNVLYGGIISSAPGTFLNCYSYTNHRNDAIAAFVSFADDNKTLADLLQ